MLKYLAQDIKRYLTIGTVENKAIFQKIFIIIFAYGLHASVVYRFGRSIESMRKKNSLIPVYHIVHFIYLCANFAIERMYGIHIDRKATIGKGFYIGHVGGIFIGRCNIGENCSVHQQVKIGKKLNMTKNGEIVIGNNVWIGAHSEIAPGVNIDDESTILVGSSVKTNVIKGSLVMGSPARMILRKYDNKSLLNLPKA